MVENVHVVDNVHMVDNRLEEGGCSPETGSQGEGGARRQEATEDEAGRMEVAPGGGEQHRPWH